MKENRMRLFESESIIKSFVREHGSEFPDIAESLGIEEDFDLELEDTDLSECSGKMKMEDLDMMEEDLDLFEEDFELTEGKAKVAEKGAKAVWNKTLGKWVSANPWGTAAGIGGVAAGGAALGSVARSESLDMMEEDFDLFDEDFDLFNEVKVTTKGGLSSAQQSLKQPVVGGKTPVQPKGGKPSPKGKVTPVQPKGGKTTPKGKVKGKAEPGMFKQAGKWWGKASTLKKAGVVGAGLATAGGLGYLATRKPTAESTVAFAKYGVRRFAEQQMINGCDRKTIVHNIVENLRESMNLCEGCENPERCRAKLSNEIARLVD